jgi:hypothetical protein
VTLSAPFLLSKDKHSLPIRTLVVTAFATLLGVHSAIELYESPINTVTLGVCAAVFLSKVFQLCREQTSVEVPLRDVEPQASAPPRILVRLQSIAFRLTIMSAVGCLALFPLCSFEEAVSGKWWQNVFSLAGIDGSRWILICFLVTK